MKSKVGGTVAWLWKNVKAEQLLDGLLRDFSVASEVWRFQKPEMIEFIRRQAAAGELVNWTIALVNTEGNAGVIRLGGYDAGIAERSPEKETWGEKTPSIFATRNANIQSPSHQAVDLTELLLDSAMLENLLNKRTTENGEPLFDDEDAALLQDCVGQTLAVAAERLTALRNPPEVGETKRARINGQVARELRPITHGLLLIYPVAPKEVIWPKESPFMGLGFSFPSSHTARSVDYKVNKIWQATFRDEDYED